MASTICFADSFENIRSRRKPGKGRRTGMPTTIRLQRTGRKAQASFRIVVSDSAESRDGPAIETIGTYNPRTRPSLIRLDAAAALNWLHEGAAPSETVVSIFRKTGVWEKFKSGATAETLEETVIELGPPEGQRGTSRRAEIAAEAQKEAAKRRMEEKAVAEAAAKKAAADAAAAKKAEEEAAKAAAEAEAAEAEAETEAADEPAEEVEAVAADEPAEEVEAEEAAAEAAGEEEEAATEESEEPAAAAEETEVEETEEVEAEAAEEAPAAEVEEAAEETEEVAEEEEEKKD